jgi:uncharacterized membrane protein (UPF0127 family)
MKTFLIILVLFALLFIIFSLFRTSGNSQVIINNKTYTVDVAKTEPEKNKGLSGRKYLAPNSGMLFVFEKPGVYPFWMKDTLIPLDIIYINNNKVVEITTLQPQSSGNIPRYTPQNKADYVLELNANSGVKVGDNVNISIN